MRSNSSQSITLPSDVVASDDDFWNDVTDYLQQTGYVPANHKLTELKITVAAEEPIRVTHYRSERFVP